MQIIFLHPRFTKAKSLTLGPKHIATALVVFLFTVVMCSALMLYVVFAIASTNQFPVINDMFASVAQDEAGRNARHLKQNLGVMAVKLGEMQAQLMRLDALGERVQGLAGVKPEAFNFKEKPGRGGIDLPVSGGKNDQEQSMTSLQQMLEGMEKDIERRVDYMNVVETALMGLKIKSRLLPTIQPVRGSYNASSFGVRFDPFTGRRAMHEGIDFPAPNGTKIVAAAGGVVIAAEYHHEYGNMLDIDHGNDIITRYAHASTLYVNVGDIIKRGQYIADVGSTGRSTGAHLHFEVRVKGVAQDPHKFLLAGANQAKALELAGE
jgi:murein DD-endopeptidase MepM/ murein hydrolase activator NlpD